MGWDEATVAEFARALAAPGPDPAGGAAAAIVCAYAAGLLELASGGDTAARAAELRERALALADRDVAAYAGLVAALREGAPAAELDAARSAASEPALAVAEAAAEIASLADRANPGDARGADAAAAAELARGARLAALAIADANRPR